MPGPTRWILSALFLLSPALYAAEYPTFNTSIEWRNDMKQATAEATSTNRLLFVMHLSGNLARSAFT